MNYNYNKDFPPRIGDEVAFDLPGLVNLTKGEIVNYDENKAVVLYAHFREEQLIELPIDRLRFLKARKQTLWNKIKWFFNANAV